MTDSDRQVSPHGSYEVFVGVSVSMGPGNLPPRCMVAFRFPHGYRGGLAVRKNALTGGKAYDQRIDGTLYPAPFTAVNHGPPL
jgi:hypothetical protein